MGAASTTPERPQGTVRSTAHSALLNCTEQRLCGDSKLRVCVRENLPRSGNIGGGVAHTLASHHVSQREGSLVISVSPSANPCSLCSRPALT